MEDEVVDFEVPVHECCFVFWLAVLFTAAAVVIVAVIGEERAQLVEVWEWSDGDSCLRIPCQGLVTG